MSGGAVQIDRLAEQLKRLKLARTADQLPALLQEASKKELPYTFLEDLLGRELLAKQERHTAMKTSMARFPFHKSLERERRVRYGLPNTHLGHGHCPPSGVACLLETLLVVRAFHCDTRT